MIKKYIIRYKLRLNNTEPKTSRGQNLTSACYAYLKDFFIILLKLVAELPTYNPLPSLPI